MIGTCVLGVGIGLLGRLFLANPEVFLVVVTLTLTAGPFLLAVGTIVWIGLRGRRPGLVAWGIVLLVTPFIGFGGQILVRQLTGPSPGGLGLQTTQQLLEQRLPKQIDEPWVWNELERRLKGGRLSQQEVDDAVKRLISHMTATRPNGWNSPLSWQDSFLKSARQAGAISDPVLIDLCDAFFGPKPVISPLPRVRDGANGFGIEVHYGSPWSDASGFGMRLLWQVDRVLLDGKPIAVRQVQKSGQEWTGFFDGGVRAGEHEVTVDVECAYVDENRLTGLNATELPKTRWPAAHKRWKQSVSAPLKAYSPDTPIVSLVTASSRDPGPTGGIVVQRFVAQADQGQKRKIILKIEFAKGLPVPLSYDIAAEFEGRSVKLGSAWVVQSERGSTQGGSQLEGIIDSLGPSALAGDILLTPNPSHIEQRSEVAEIWGKSVVLRGVVIERLDLEKSGE